MTIQSKFCFFPFLYSIWMILYFESVDAEKTARGISILKIVLPVAHKWVISDVIL